MAKQPKRTAAAETGHAAEPVKAPDDARFTASKWHGLDNFTCARCPFATLERNAMLDHAIAHEQRDAFERRPQLSGLIVDTDGEPITEQGG